MRNQIIIEAEEYKKAFYEKKKTNCERSQENNREREKVKTFEYDDMNIFSFLALSVMDLWLINHF